MDRVSIPSTPPISTIEGRTEMEPNKLDTHSNIVLDEGLLTLLAEVLELGISQYERKL